MKRIIGLLVIMFMLGGCITIQRVPSTPRPMGHKMEMREGSHLKMRGKMKGGMMMHEMKRDSSDHRGMGMRNHGPSVEPWMFDEDYLTN